MVINGPNLDRLGSREPEVYGSATYADLVSELIALGAGLDFDVDIRQSASESEIISWLHEAADSSIPVIMNPAAFSHYSYAIRDACAMLTAPLIEVHISNPAAREEFRHKSVISGVATGVIAGFGIDSYRMALQALARM